MFDRSVSGHVIRAMTTSTSLLGSLGWDPATNEIIYDGNSVLFCDDSDDWTFDADFMVELPGVKFSTVSTRQWLIAHWRGATGQRSWFCDFRGDLSTKRIDVYLSTDGTNVALQLQSTFAASADTAYDIAFNRIGSTVRCFAGASGGALPMLNSDTLAGALNNSDHQLIIGSGGGTTANSVGSTDRFTGRMKNVPRITKGSGRGGDDDGYTFPETIWPTS